MITISTWWLVSLLFLVSAVIAAIDGYEEQRAGDSRRRNS